MPAPANDLIANAQFEDLSPGSVAFGGTTVDATDAEDAFLPDGPYTGPSVWYWFTPPFDGTVTLELTAESFSGGGHSYAEIYSGPDVSVVTTGSLSVECGGSALFGPPVNSMNCSVLAANTYYIYVSNDTGGPSHVGTFSYTLSIAAEPCTAPDNDLYPDTFGKFLNRSIYYLGTNCGGCREGTTFCATAEAGEPDPNPGDPATNSVWYTFESPFTGNIRFRVLSSDPGMALPVYAVYTWVGGPPSGLGAALAQGNAGSPNADLAVSAGDDLAIQVDTLSGGGPFTLHWELLPAGAPPANDDFANAQLLTTECGSLTVTLTDANAECGEPTGADDPDGPYNTVWYEWTPTYTGLAIFSISAVTAGFHDLDIDVFTGATLDGLTLVASHEFFGTPPPGLQPGYYAFGITAGTTYFIRWQARGEALTFLMSWQTDENPWKIRVGTFTVGDTLIHTGLGKAASALIVMSSGCIAGQYPAGSRIGMGAYDGTNQNAASYGYPWRIHDGTNGAQYGQPHFQAGKVISLIDETGILYAEAAATSFNVDGSVSLSWSTNPGDGTMLGFVAFSGIPATVGSGVLGDVAGTDTVAPGFAAHAGFVWAAGANDMYGFSEVDSGFSASSWTGPGPGANTGAGMIAGVSWFGAHDDEGDFFPGNVTFAYISDSDATTMDITKGKWNGNYGWLALGGCDWQSRIICSITGVNPNPGQYLSFPTDFWTQGGVMFGTEDPFMSSPTTNPVAANAIVTNFGAFDERGNQFSLSDLQYPATGGFHNFQTPSIKNCYADRALSSPADYTSEQYHAIVSLPGRPHTGGMVTYTPFPNNAGQAHCAIIFGNQFPGAVGPVSFSYIRTNVGRGPLSVR